MPVDPSGSDASCRMRTYRPPPSDFDPRTASDAVLVRHGLPRRPSADGEPGLARIWERLFARPVTFVEAELSPAPSVPGRDRLRASQTHPSGWAGVTREKHERAGSDFQEPATFVFANLIVPHVYDVHPADQDWNVGFWVGLDRDEMILQGGVAANLETESVFSFGDGVDWYAWVEWWLREGDSPPSQVTNFPVSPGDTISLLVCGTEPDFGLISMLNISKGYGTSIGVPAPTADIRLQGGSAEWIVEAPTASPGLPYFSPVTFYDCLAGSAHELFHLEPGGIVTNITADTPSIDAPGPEITRTWLLPPAAFMVFWEGFGEIF